MIIFKIRGFCSYFSNNCWESILLKFLQIDIWSEFFSNVWRIIFFIFVWKKGEMPKIAHISQPFFFPFALSPYYYFFVDYMFSRNFNPIRGVIRNMHTSVFFGFLRNTQKFMKKKHSFQFKNNLTQNSSMHYPPPPLFFTW